MAQKVVATNRSARHDYTIEDTYEAGLVLDRHRGEVAARRAARRSSTATPSSTAARPGSTPCTSPSTPRAPGPTTPPRRKRKLLLHKDADPQDPARVKEGGYTLVPLQIYFSDGRAKVEIAVAKGKREYDKRQALRERQDKREAERAMARRRRD